MGEFEAVGDAVTGGLVGRAVEPTAGEPSDGHTHEKTCLNCGCELVGDFCHCCGQRAHVHRTLMAFWHDLAHGVLHLDGKIWSTLPLLALRPGELTRRYVDGERAKFVSPMALFLFSVFLMFAVLSLVGGGIRESSQTTVVADPARAQSELERVRDTTKVELTRLQEQRDRLAAAGQPTASLDSNIREKQAEVAIEERLTRGFVPERDAVATVNATRSANGELTFASGSKQIDDWFNAAYKKAKQNPNLLLYKLQSNAYKFSWLLIPISIPLVWLLFLHRRRYRREFTAYDHTVFVTYSIAFMSLGAIALSLLDWAGLPSILFALAIVIIPPLHMYRQLKGAYGLSRWSAIWRTFVLIMFAFMAIALFFSMLLAVGALG